MFRFFTVATRYAYKITNSATLRGQKRLNFLFCTVFHIRQVIKVKRTNLIGILLPLLFNHVFFHRVIQPRAFPRVSNPRFSFLFQSAARQIERDRELMYSDDDDDFSSGEEARITLSYG